MSYSERLSAGLVSVVFIRFHYSMGHNSRRSWLFELCCDWSRAGHVMQSTSSDWSTAGHVMCRVGRKFSLCLSACAVNRSIFIRVYCVHYILLHVLMHVLFVIMVFLLFTCTVPYIMHVSHGLIADFM